MKRLLNKIVFWIKNNKKEAVILGFILLVASICRLYKIDQYMTFLGDEGRDVIVVRRIFTELHPPLIGPGTSVGNLYLGPLYYYMMALPLLLANFSPVGPAVQIAILGVITVAFVWWVGRIWFGKRAGVIAAGLYAISPTVIYYSRSSWNPNIMPFFALLCIYSIWKVWNDRKMGWLIILGISFAFVLQSHYLGLLLTPTLFIFWLLSFFRVRKTDLEKKFIKNSVIGIILFLLLMSPLLIFDLRHNWTNARAIYAFLAASQTTVSAKPWAAIPKLPVMLNLVNSSVLAAKDITATLIASIVIAAGIIWVFLRNYLKRKSLKLANQYWLIFSWLGFGLIGLGLYKENIYDHYLGFMFVVPFLLIGSIISMLLSGGKIIKWLGVLLLLYLIGINIVNNPLRKEPNRLLQRSEDVARLIVKEAAGKPMNLAVIADTNYEAGYQYFVELYGGKVLEIDATNPSTFANQLFAVCELIPTSKCDPTHNPKSQIASFGWSKIDSSWPLDGVIIYKLVHTQ
ncbi:MAG: glycosyltransferase family 39 protein [Candidatus Microgenomates bacterium]